jgi:uncharacterized protein (DUF2235 family)
MPKKNIVVLSDGTGNSSAKSQKTNVWRLYEAIPQRDGQQIARYDNGVGTSSNKYLALFGGAFGWGLKRNVLDLYKFVCRNYQAGDDIYGFGFSRGAFTIRVLVGLITCEGLVDARSEEELDRYAIAAYRHYRTVRFTTWSPFVIVLRWLRDSALRIRDRLKGNATYDEVSAATEAAGRKQIRIKFLGLWDTVEAYGIPIPELKRGIDWVIWPMMFKDQTLSSLVDRACHALSLDDQRTTFHPILWDEEAEAKAVSNSDPAKRVPPGRITQVWFAGVHSNVGGGYPEDQLSLISLEWIMHEAMANRLKLNPAAVKQVGEAKTPYGRLFDSRAGLAAYYRYAPRSIPIWYHGKDEIRPIVDSSVIVRMATGSDRYAPISLPPHFWVLAPNGQLLPMEGFGQPIHADATKAASGVTVGTKTKVQNALSELQKAMESLARPEKEHVATVWDIVWWRRLFYFVTVSLTTILALYPWLGGAFAQGTDWLLHGAINSVVKTGGDVSRPILTSGIDALSGLIPGYAHPWTTALENHPVEFTALTIALLLCIIKSTGLQTQIRDRAWLAWHTTDEADAANRHGVRKHGPRPGSVILLFIAAGLLIVSIVRAWRIETQIELWVLTGLILVYVAWRSAERVSLTKSARPEICGKTFGLILARKVRENLALQTFSRWTFQDLVPILFAFAVIALGIILTNRLVFDAASAAGQFCAKPIVDPQTPVTATTDAKKEIFATDAPCWYQGEPIKAGHRYRIRIIDDVNWFDSTIRTDAQGFAASDLVHYLGTPLKRWWSENWFTPIARVGELGNDEYALHSVDPVDEHTYCINPTKFARATATDLQNNCPSDQAELHKASKWTQEQCAACQACVSMSPETNAKHWFDISAKATGNFVNKFVGCSPTPEERTEFVAEIEAKSSGALYLYVNDAVLMLPFVRNIFYENNTGTATVVVEELKRVPPKLEGGDESNHQADPPLP